MHLVSWLCFLTLEKWPFVGDVFCVPAVDASLITRAVYYSVHALHVGCMGLSVVAGCLLWAAWQVWMTLRLVGCQALPCVEAAYSWLMGLGPGEAEDLCC